MTEPIRCGHCDEPLTEPNSTPADRRQPCPKCGSTSRVVSVGLAEEVSISDSATARVIPYPEHLLDIARRLIDQGNPNIAVVTSHMACELAADEAFDAAYAAKNLQTLGEAVDGLMNGHNLANDRHRKLYNALTGTQLEKQSFWQAFKEASDKRNAIVHKRGHATPDEAKAALQAAEELINFLRKTSDQTRGG